MKRLLVAIGCVLSLSFAAYAEPAKAPAAPEAKPAVAAPATAPAAAPAVAAPAPAPAAPTQGDGADDQESPLVRAARKRAQEAQKAQQR